MLTHRIFDWAKRAPHKPAVIGPDRLWTYEDFADAVARARGRFVREGVFGSGMASVAVENQIEVWILTLALRSLGLTTMNRGFDLDDAPMLRCVVQSAREEIPNLKALCAAGDVPLLEISLEDETPVGLDEGPQIERPGGQILHTSGTTGVHKKVLLDSSIEDALIERRRRLAKIDENTVLTAFDCPVWTGVGHRTPATAWSSGATVVIDRTAPYAPLLQPTLTHGITTPLLLRAILAAPEGAFPCNERLELWCGGGTLRWSEVEKAKQRITPHIFNLISSTETNPFGLTPMEAPEDVRWHRPVPDVEAQIVDERDQLLPAGQSGRLRVSTLDGPQSYLNDEKATASFFRGGWFYTGDLGFRREDGRFALQGRVTEVINIDGVKIAPAPIEERLGEVVGAQVILLTIQDNAGDEELHVAIEAAVLPVTENLSKALWAEFGQLVRAHVHVFPAFPRTATGKVRRPQLSAQIIAERQAKLLAPRP